MMYVTCKGLAMPYVTKAHTKQGSIFMVEKETLILSQPSLTYIA